MKYLLVALCCLSSLMMQAQENIFKTIPDPKEGASNILVGQLQFSDIAADATCNWFSENAQNYTADTNICKALATVIPKFELVIFAGTWCGDTHHLLPQLYTVLSKAKTLAASMELYGVDRKKRALNVEHLLYKIEKVPTVIIIRNHREVARIVETVEGMIEDNLLRIMQKDLATHQD